MWKFLLLILFSVLASQVSAQSVFTVQGTMKHTDLEGGCWYLDAGEKHYELLASKDTLQLLHVEGKFLTLNVMREDGVASICMVGQIVRVVSIRDSIRHAVDPMASVMRLTGRIRRTNSGCYFIEGRKHQRYIFSLPNGKHPKVGSRYDRYVRVAFGTPAVQSPCTSAGTIVAELPGKNKGVQERRDRAE